MRIPAFLLLFSFLVSCSSKETADLIVINAKVYTVNSGFTTAEAFAVKDGKFIRVGTTEEIQNKFKTKETIDAQGKPVYPGFYDAHAHFPSLAEFLGQVDLNGSKSFEEVVERLKSWEQKNPDKTWIIGGGWIRTSGPGNSFLPKICWTRLFQTKRYF